MNIKKTVGKKGLYFGHFEKLEEAEEWLESQIRRYLFTPNPKKMSVNRICKEAQEKGINLYPNSFLKELKRRNIDIRDSRPRPTKKESRTFTINKEVSNQLREFPDGTMSFLAELGLRIVLGFPTEDLVMFLPEEGEETTLIFHKKRQNRIQLYISGEVDQKFEQQLRNLLDRSEKKGMEEIIKYAKNSGFRFYGGSSIN